MHDALEHKQCNNIEWLKHQGRLHWQLRFHFDTIQENFKSNLLYRFVIVLTTTTGSYHPHHVASHHLYHKYPSTTTAPSSLSSNNLSLRKSHSDQKREYSSNTGVFHRS